MRHNILACAVSLAFVAGTIIVATGIPTSRAVAAEDKPPSANSQPSCTCPSEPSARPETSWPRPKFAELKQSPVVLLDESDEIAALDAIRFALVEVADGSAYVWHRYHGRLSGVVQPTASFKDAAGNVCRHIITTLASEQSSTKVEGIACRLPDGNWQLDG
jgi:surface antigen